MTTCVRLLYASAALIVAALLLLPNVGTARSEVEESAQLPVKRLRESVVEPHHTRFLMGNVRPYVPSQDETVERGFRSASVKCHRQEVTLEYLDAANKPYIRFTGTKKWCFNGRKVTWGTMDVTEAWIRSDKRLGLGKDGYVYVPSGLKKTDRFLPYKGRPNGAHESTRTGRFEYRFSGVPGPAQVIMPFVSRTGHYDGTCSGPRSTDISPKVTRTKPTRGAQNVPTTLNVEATFSERMDASTFTTGTFVLNRDGDLDRIGATYRYDATTKTAILDPREPLTPGTYTATVWNGPYGVKTIQGDPIIWTKTWTFRVVR